jgi:hypothetical protein
MASEKQARADERIGCLILLLVVAVGVAFWVFVVGVVLHYVRG